VVGERFGVLRFRDSGMRLQTWLGSRPCGPQLLVRRISTGYPWSQACTRTQRLSLRVLACEYPFAQLKYMSNERLDIYRREFAQFKIHVKRPARYLQEEMDMAEIRGLCYMGKQATFVILKRHNSSGKSWWKLGEGDTKYESLVGGAKDFFFSPKPF
jgi:hypothetical protein